MIGMKTPSPHRTHPNGLHLCGAAVFVCAALAISAAGCQFHTSSGPCSGWHTDVKACIDAAANSEVIAQVKLGQTSEEVRAIMRKDPARREASADMESWSYRTDYEHEMFTTIIFKNNIVVEIKQTPWDS